MEICCMLKKKEKHKKKKLTQNIMFNIETLCKPWYYHWFLVLFPLVAVVCRSIESVQLMLIISSNQPVCTLGTCTNIDVSNLRSSPGLHTWCNYATAMCEMLRGISCQRLQEACTGIKPYGPSGIWPFLHTPSGIRCTKTYHK